jgi:hypothetical protein
MPCRRARPRYDFYLALRPSFRVWPTQPTKQPTRANHRLPAQRSAEREIQGNQVILEGPMTHTIFFSWQLDTLPEWGRNFIERALTAAIKKLLADLTVEEAIRNEGLTVDRDTRNVAGTPPIVDTIFKKIDSARAFLADITFVGKRLDGRPTPNPNVLLEYGWALRAHGYSRIITVMNTAYGEPSDLTLPFNMKHLTRPITYELPKGADDATKQRVRAGLESALRGKLKMIIESEEFKASAPKPAEVPKFAPRPPVYGPARFRGMDEPIGIIQGPFGIGGNKAVTLVAGPAIWLRVMPDRQQARQWAISELRDALSSGERTLRPLGFFQGFNPVRSADGYGYVPTMVNVDDPVPSVILAFKSGEVWAVYVGPLLQQTQTDTIPNVERLLTECFVQCVLFLRDGLKIDLPYRWVAGMEEMKGKRMQKIAAPGKGYIDPFTGPCLDPLVMETGILSSTDIAQLGLRNFFRKLYDAFGEERPDHMDSFLTGE